MPSWPFDTGRGYWLAVTFDGALCRAFNSTGGGARGELQLGRGARLSQQVSLDKIDPRLAQHLELLLRLDSLGRGQDIEADGERAHRRYDRGAFLALGQILRERLVDLDLVEWEFREVAERRI